MLAYMVSNPCFEVWILFHHLANRRSNGCNIFKDCDKVIDHIKENYDDHHGRSRPLKKDDYYKYELVIEFAKDMDSSPNNPIPDNPGSRIYKFLERLKNK